MDKLKKIFASRKFLLGFLFFGAIVLVIPITLNLLSQNQDIRQHASGPDDTSLTPTPTGCARNFRSDANCDGKVDTDDFNIWRDEYLSSQASLPGTMQITPQQSNVVLGQTINVVLHLDSGNTPFNAAKATVTISPQLTIQNVTLGNCNFTMVQTPSNTDASFAGVILGNSTKACDLYTLTLKAITAGSATITLTNTSMKSYGQALEILSSARGGNFTVTN